MKSNNTKQNTEITSLLDNIPKDPRYHQELISLAEEISTGSYFSSIWNHGWQSTSFTKT